MRIRTRGRPVSLKQPAAFHIAISRFAIIAVGYIANIAFAFAISVTAGKVLTGVIDAIVQRSKSR